ncbi:MAG: hypothetical protein WC428_06625 [Candidatus Paceibacterota bacterium]
MSRPKGSKNAPVDVKKGNNIIDTIEKLKDHQYGEYRICHANDVLDIVELVEANINLGYQPQGGVSVTNYRGLDGNIVMVYCQAMVRREG